MVVGTETHTRGRQVGSTRGVQDDVLVLASLADPGVDKVPLGVLHGIAFNITVALSTKNLARLLLEPGRAGAYQIWIFVPSDLLPPARSTRNLGSA
jgi:hypothetical protein